MPLVIKEEDCEEEKEEEEAKATEVASSVSDSAETSETFGPQLVTTKTKTKTHSAGSSLVLSPQPSKEEEEEEDDNAQKVEEEERVVAGIHGQDVQMWNILSLIIKTCTFKRNHNSQSNQEKSSKSCLAYFVLVLLPMYGCIVVAAAVAAASVASLSKCIFLALLSPSSSFAIHLIPSLISHPSSFSSSSSFIPPPLLVFPLLTQEDIFSLFLLLKPNPLGYATLQQYFATYLQR